MSVAILRGDARSLPLPDECVDLIVTSPPYFGLRDYRDGDESLTGQIGSEATPQAYIAALIECTREWVRVLKPSGSLFVNLGDKYVADNRGSGVDVKRGAAKHAPAGPAGYPGREMARHKSLLGLPWRYALACTDDLGLILRRDIIWSKPNGLPESVTDRCRSSHEYVFHFTRRPRYYSAVDEIREPQAESWRSTGRIENRGRKGVDGGANNGFGLSGATPREYNPLGKLPGSVWAIPSQPLTVPASLGIDHFAAFPVDLPRRIIAGWSPPGICLECGEGRRPVSVTGYEPTQRTNNPGTIERNADNNFTQSLRPHGRARALASITGYACACDHPTAPTRAAIVLDPFAGTGTTLLAADALGRHAIGTDLSAGYCRLAQWRTTDPGERAKAWEVPKPPPILPGQQALFP
jgi:DNA modification methylase